MSKTSLNGLIPLQKHNRINENKPALNSVELSAGIALFILIVFFGDSITQGHQTVAKMDVFGHDVVIFLCDVIMTEIPVVADAESVELIDQIHN